MNYLMNNLAKFSITGFSSVSLLSENQQLCRSLCRLVGPQKVLAKEAGIRHGGQVCVGVCVCVCARRSGLCPCRLT